MLRLGELLEEGLRRVELERQRRLIDGSGGSLLAHLLTLEIALERVEEETVMWDAVPVEDLLLLLRADALVLEQQIKEWRLRGGGVERSATRDQRATTVLGANPRDRTSPSRPGERFSIRASQRTNRIWTSKDLDGPQHARACFWCPTGRREGGKGRE